MAQLTISRDIRPLSDLSAKTTEIVDQATASRQPVVLTRRGRGVAVLLAVAEYERLLRAAEHGALVAALKEGEQDYAAGRVELHDDVKARWLGVGDQGAARAGEKPDTF